MMRTLRVSRLAYSSYFPALILRITAAAIQASAAAARTIPTGIVALPELASTRNASAEA
mgnify:CR=1 FL=1